MVASHGVLVYVYGCVREEREREREREREKMKENGCICTFVCVRDGKDRLELSIHDLRVSSVCVDACACVFVDACWC